MLYRYLLWCDRQRHGELLFVAGMTAGTVIFSTVAIFIGLFLARVMQ